MQVRLIEKADIEPLIELGRHMHAQSPVYSPYPFSEPTLRGWLVAAVERPSEVFCAVAEKAGELVGVFLACIGPMLISTCKVAYEQTLFVYERFRGTTAAFLLNQAFLGWAMRNDCVAADVGVSAGISDEAALRFYRKTGYKDHGLVLRKEI